MSRKITPPTSPTATIKEQNTHPYRSPQWLMTLATLGLVLAGLSSGCGDDGFDSKSVLQTYRVVALRAEPPELSLIESSVLSVYDFHPDELEGDRPSIEYSWRLCLFSLGSITQYDCLLEEIPLDDLLSEEMMSEPSEDAESSSLPPANASLTLNPAALLATLGEDLQMQMEQLEMGAGMLGSEMNFFESGISEVYVKLTVEIEGEPNFELVKSMTISFDDERTPNQNPQLDEVSLSEDINEDESLPISSTLELEVSAREGSAEDYQTPQSAEDIKEGIPPEVITESLLVSYYTTSGEFDQAVKLVDDSMSELTLGEEPGEHLLYIVLRDGRGGVDLQRLAFKVEESE